MPRWRRVAVACVSCRLERKRCDGSKPCERCTARGLTCSYSAAEPRIRLAQSEAELATAVVNDAAKESFLCRINSFWCIFRTGGAQGGGFLTAADAAASDMVAPLPIDDLVRKAFFARTVGNFDAMGELAQAARKLGLGLMGAKSIEAANALLVGGGPLASDLFMTCDDMYI